MVARSAALLGETDDRVLSGMHSAVKRLVFLLSNRRDGGGGGSGRVFHGEMDVLYSSDLMLPGVVVPSSGFPQVEQGTLCAVTLLGNRYGGLFVHIFLETENEAILSKKTLVVLRE